MVSYRNPPLGPLSPGRAQRRDSLPEFKDYADTGCHLHSACLTCPFSTCLAEEGPSPHKARSLALTSHLQALRDSGLTVMQVVAATGVSRRTAYRRTHA